MSTKTRKPPADPLADWAQSFAAGLTALQSLSQWLAPPPNGAANDPNGLALLLETRGLLSVNEDAARPGEEAAQRLAEKVTGASRREDLQDRLAEALKGIDLTIGAALDHGAQDPRIIRSADFGTGIHRIQQPNGQIGPKGWPGAALLYLGALSSLPPDHYLRSVLPADDYYLLDSTNPNSAALVLGPAEATLVGIGRPRRFYLTAPALRWTSFFRTQQKEKLHQQEEADRREAEQRQKDFWNSPIGQLERRRRLLDAMREKGKLPPEPADDAAVLRGLI